MRLTTGLERTSRTGSFQNPSRGGANKFEGFFQESLNAFGILSTLRAAKGRGAQGERGPGQPGGRLLPRQYPQGDPQEHQGPWAPLPASFSRIGYPSKDAKK